jgi:hypothetical protein
MKKIFSILAAGVCAINAQAVTTNVTWVLDHPTAMMVHLEGIGFERGSEVEEFDLTSPRGLWRIEDIFIYADVLNNQVLSGMSAGLNFMGRCTDIPFFGYDDWQPFETLPVVAGEGWMFLPEGWDGFNFLAITSSRLLKNPVVSCSG